jgi:hypothetical protein
MMQFRSYKEQDKVSVAPSSELRYLGHGSDHVMNLELVPCLTIAPGDVQKHRRNSIYGRNKLTICSLDDCDYIHCKCNIVYWGSVQG